MLPPISGTSNSSQSSALETFPGSQLRRHAVAVAVEQEQRVITDRLEMPVVGATFLLPIHLALWNPCRAPCGRIRSNVSACPITSRFTAISPTRFSSRVSCHPFWRGSSDGTRENHGVTTDRTGKSTTAKSELRVQVFGLYFSRESAITVACRSARPLARAMTRSVNWSDCGVRSSSPAENLNDSTRTTRGWSASASSCSAIGTSCSRIGSVWNGIRIGCGGTSSA